MTQRPPPFEEPSGTELPALARWLVRTLCAAAHVEELEGDLLELFARRAARYGIARARWASVVDALGLCARRSRFTGPRRGAGLGKAGELRVYWGLMLVVLGLVGVFAAACVMLSLVSPKLAALIAFAWFFPDPIFVLSAALKARRARKRGSRARG